jgi:hypothetical protein
VILQCAQTATTATHAAILIQNANCRIVAEGNGDALTSAQLSVVNYMLCETLNPEALNSTDTQAALVTLEVTYSAYSAKPSRTLCQVNWAVIFVL